MVQPEVLTLLKTERNEVLLAFKGAAGLLPRHSSGSHSAPPIQELWQELVLALAVRAQAELCPVCIVDIFFHGSGFSFSCPQVQFPVALVCAVRW